MIIDDTPLVLLKRDQICFLQTMWMQFLQHPTKSEWCELGIKNFKLQNVHRCQCIFDLVQV
jgi:hypothetical protein